MKGRKENVDLLGTPSRRKRPKYEAALERQEIREVPSRAARVRWLSGIMPGNTLYAMPLQTMAVFREAKDCFIYGQYVAAQVLAAGFIEHWLGSLLFANGQGKAASAGLGAIVAASREHRILPGVVCDKIDALRLNRNPFVHLKDFEHPHSLTQRALAARSHFEDVLEADAREAMVVMYSVARYASAQV